MRTSVLTLSGAALLSTVVFAQSDRAATMPSATEADRGHQPPGPYLVKDINSTGGSEPGGFVRFNGATYFYANDGIHGFELWKTDGSGSGTQLIQDINPGDLHSAPQQLTPFLGRLYFAATTAETGRELWSTDGTALGTTLVHDINPGALSSDPSTLLKAGQSLVFRAGNDAGAELWMTGTTAGSTRLIVDLHPGAQGSVPTYPTRLRGAVYFSADDSVAPGGGFDRELWKTDGTAAGTVRVKDINPGPGTSIPGELTRLGERIVFKAQEPGFGPELWQTDGTEEGTTLLADINPGPAAGFPSNLVTVGREIFFIADDGQSGRELWKTDGSANGTVRVKDINPGAESSSPIGVPFRGGYLFAADHVDYGRELWFSDGSEAGTRLVKDINPGPELSTPLGITVTGQQAWFPIVRQTGAGDGTVLTELWRTDGTEEGTVRVWRAPGRYKGYAIAELARSGDHLFFGAPTSEDANGTSADFELYGIQLRRGDGAVEQAEVVQLDAADGDDGTASGK